MRILLISRRVNFIQSAPKCNTNLALTLAKLGHKVHVLTSYIDDTVKQLFAKDKIILHKISKRFALRSIAPLTYTMLAKRIKKTYSIDLVIGNGYTFQDDITWVHFLRLAYFHRLKEAKLTPSPKLKFEALIEKQLLKSSNILWAVSYIIAKSLMITYGFPRNRIIVLHNGVDTDFYKPLPRRERVILREKHGVHSELVLLFVGSDPIIKGLYLLLNALSKIKERREIRLYVVGLKPNREILSYIHKLGLRECVKILGFLKEKQLRLYYQLSDVFILPSLYDSFPLSPLEAMACGSIPIVSRYNGVSEIIINNVNGFVVDPYDENAIISVLTDLMGMSAASVESIRERALRTARMHSWCEIAKKLLENIEMRLNR